MKKVGLRGSPMAEYAGEVDSRGQDSGRASEREGRNQAARGGGVLIQTCPRVHACIAGAFGFLSVYSHSKKAGSGACSYTRARTHMHVHRHTQACTTTRAIALAYACADTRVYAKTQLYLHAYAYTLNVRCISTRPQE